MVFEKYLIALVVVLKRWLLALIIILKRYSIASFALLKRWLTTLVIIFKKNRLLSQLIILLERYLSALFVIIKKRRWPLLIALPAIMGVLAIFFLSTFETITYQTREGQTIEYKVPLSLTALIPAYLLWASSILLIFAIVPTSYYFISRRLEEKLEMNMKIISKLISKNNIGSKKKPMKMDNKDVILRFLNLNERKVIKKLIDRKGTALQSEITQIDGMTKLKTHRAVRDLERKSIIKTEPYGKTNRLILSREIKEFLTK